MDSKKPGSGWGTLWSPKSGAPAALLILYVANAVFTPRFATVSNTLNMLLQVSTTMFVAVGMTFAIASRGVDLTVGSTMALVSVIVALLINQGMAVAIPAALGGALLVGLLNGFVISRLKLEPMITTLAALIMWRGVAQVVGDGQLVPFVHPTFEALGKGYLGHIPIQVVIAAVVIASAFFCIRSTLFGRHLVAVGDNEEASRLMGVSPNRVKLAAYTISGLLSGLAGVVLAGRLGAGQPMAALGWETDAIAAAVMGGTFLGGGQGSVFPTLAGVLLLGMMYNILNLEGTITPWWQLVLRGGFLLLVVIFQQRIAQRKRAA